MDQKMALSAIGVGVGVGLGIGFAMGKTVSKWRGNMSSSWEPITADTMAKEMMRMVVDGKDSQVIFGQFPHYISGYFLTANWNNSEQTRVLLTSAAYVHLMKNNCPDYMNGKLLISSESLSHGLSIFREGNASGKDALKLEVRVEEGRIKTKSDSPVDDKKGTTDTVVSVAKAETVINPRHQQKLL